jgi:hypothetical protein
VSATTGNCCCRLLNSLAVIGRIVLTKRLNSSQASLKGAKALSDSKRFMQSASGDLIKGGAAEIAIPSEEAVIAARNSVAQIRIPVRFPVAVRTPECRLLLWKV